MARYGYKCQIWPNGEFSVGYVPPKKFSPDPLPPPGKRVFSFEWLSQENKERVCQWVQERLAKQEASIDSSHPPNSHKRGLHGITSYGKRLVRNAAYLLQLKHGKECMSFVTLTLPSVSREELSIIAQQWSHIVRVYCQSLKRELIRNGLSGKYVGVTEVQERRLSKRGELGLHLHILFQGRANRRKGWAIPPGFHREVWGGILERILGRRFDNRALENVQRVRLDAGSYLGKYMSKGTKTIGAIVEQYGESCVPSAWYTCENGLRDAVKRKIKTSWDLGEEIWSDLPLMDEAGALRWINLHQVEIEGRSFTVGCSGSLNVRKLDDRFRKYRQCVTLAIRGEL